MTQAPRARWIGWLAMLAFLAAGLLTPWLQGIETAHAMAAAGDGVRCHDPCKSPGCITPTVCVAKCLQGPMLAAAPAACVSIVAVVFEPASPPRIPARVIQPQAPPPRQ